MVQWSPASTTSWMVQSIQAAAPSRRGLPNSVRVQLDAVKRSSCLRAKARQTSCWPEVSTLAQNAPASRILAQLDDLRSGRKATSGGSSDTEVKVPTTMPTGSPSVGVAVMRVTPVGY